MATRTWLLPFRILFNLLDPRLLPTEGYMYNWLLMRNTAVWHKVIGLLFFAFKPIGSDKRQARVAIPGIYSPSNLIIMPF